MNATLTQTPKTFQPPSSQVDGKSPALRSNTIGLQIRVNHSANEDSIEKKLREELEHKTVSLLLRKMSFSDAEKLTIHVELRDGESYVSFAGPSEVKGEAIRRWRAE